MHIDHAELTERQHLERVLQVLVLYCETPALDTMHLEPSEWFAQLKGPDETDAAFLIHRFAVLPVDTFAREIMYEMLDVPMRARAGPGYPLPHRARCIAGGRWCTSDVPGRERDHRCDAKRTRAPVAMRSVSRETGMQLNRSRARNDGDQTARSRWNRLGGSVGCPPHRRWQRALVRLHRLTSRAPTDARVGVRVSHPQERCVPVGYFQAATLFGSSELNYNPLRLRGAGRRQPAIYARGVAVWCITFSVRTRSRWIPSSSVKANPEAIRTGAFWFYYKLGFRPEDARRKRIVLAERAADEARSYPPYQPRHAARPSHTSTLYVYLKEPRDDVVGKLHYGKVGLAVSRYVAGRFGADREAAIATCRGRGCRAPRASRA